MGTVQNFQTKMKFLILLAFTFLSFLNAATVTHSNFGKERFDHEGFKLLNILKNLKTQISFKNEFEREDNPFLQMLKKKRKDEEKKSDFDKFDHDFGIFKKRS